MFPVLDLSSFHPRGEGGSTLTRRVCATSVLNLPPCPGVENPKSVPCSGTKNANHIFCSGVTVFYCIVLYCIVLYCIVVFCIALYCIVLYWRQRPYLCFIYLLKSFYYSTLNLPCLCKRVINFLLLLSV